MQLHKNFSLPTSRVGAASSRDPVARQNSSRLEAAPTINNRLLSQRQS